MAPRHRLDGQRWLDRVVAADPGLTALRRASRATLSVVGAVFTVYLGLRALGQGTALTVPLLAGIVALLSTFAVNDPTPSQKRITMLLLAVTAGCSVFVGTLLAHNQVPKNLVLLAVIFAAFYVRRFGPRFLALGMIGFMAFYFSSLVQTTLAQMPLLIGAIVVGVGWAMLFLFVILPDRPERTVRRMVRACDAHAALVLDLVCEIVGSKRADDKLKKRLRRGISRLADCVASIEGQLSDDILDARVLGRQPDGLRAFWFDALLSIETIAASVQQIAAAGTTIGADVEETLLTVLQALRDAFRQRDVQGGVGGPMLIRALDALDHASASSAQGFGDGAAPRSGGSRPPSPWLYPVRRVAASARWLVDDVGGETLAASAPDEQGQREDSREEGRGDDAEAASAAEGAASGKEGTGSRGLRDRLQPTTIQAIQGVVAGAIGIVLGYLLSPAHQYWIVLAAFVVLSNAGSIGKIYIRGLERVAGTLIGAIVGFGVATVVAGSTFLEILCAFVCIFLAFYLFSVSYGLMVFWVTVMLALMYDILLGGINAQLLQARFVDTLIGAAVGFIMSTLILPTRTVDELKASVRDFLDSLDGYLSQCLDQIAGQDTGVHLVDEAFDLGNKLQQVTSLAEVVRKAPGAPHGSDRERIVSTLTIVNYYAGHLTDRPARASALTPDQQTIAQLQRVKAAISANVRALIDRIESGKATGVQDMGDVEELIENGLTAPRSERFVRSLHYIWHINQAIVDLAASLGARRGP